MSLIRRRRIPDLPSMVERMQNMVENISEEAPTAAAQMGLEEGQFGPAVDMYETDTDVVVKCELPGVDREDISVSAHSDSINISGETRREEEVEEQGYYRRELRYGQFSRTLPTPASIDPESVSAELNDGVLTVNAPKVEPEEEGTTVEID